MQTLMAKVQIIIGRLYLHLIKWFYCKNSVLRWKALKAFKKIKSVKLAEDFFKQSISYFFFHRIEIKF